MPRSKATKENPLAAALPKRLALGSVNNFLATLFYILWILIGVFFLLVIVGQIRQGALNSLVGKSAQDQAPQVTAPTETDLPGVGKVNIACVQEGLPQEAIQKLIQEGNASTLTAEEKSKLEPCIIEAESPVPTVSP